MESSIVPSTPLGDDLPDTLKRRPIYDILMSSDAGQRQVQLITAQAAKGANPGELAQFLELCATYGLDPMAKEAWCVVSGQGDRRNVMITVGRDGLRKVAARQGFRLRGDAVHEKDQFLVETNDDGTHNVKHSYGLPAARGDLVGSWCRVEDGNGVERGFHFAPLGEYRPANPNKWTPWFNQPSVMIRAASERQALAQATPLSGLVVIGEMDRGEAASITAPAGSGGDEGSGVDLGPAVEKVIAYATEIGHAGYANRAAIEIALGQRDQSYVDAWLVQAQAELDRFAAEKKTTGGATENVDAEPVPDPDAERSDIHHAETEPEDAEEVTPAPAADADPHMQIQRARLDRLIGMRDEEKTEREAEDLEAEIAMIEAQLENGG